MKSIFNTLNSERVVLGSGFMIGFVYELKLNKRTLEYPLSTIFDATLGGFLTYLGTDLLQGFVPPNLRFVFPVVACASCIYYKYNDINGLSHGKFSQKMDDSVNNKN